ncbi:MAG: Fe-S cluster assembly protein NifU [Lentisphaeraceae bacterium]|nr:Fe-S cluster assembly protein NifU [Lentisphaeraceae bacterium]
MWDYTDKVLDHFRHPRNVGAIENPDGKATVGSLACGDALTFMFKLGPDGRIAEAKFQTFGCASAVASSSALTEMVIGKTVEEAEQITNREIAEYLGGLPDQKMHCSVMGREALEAAIHNYRTGEENVVQVHDEIICTCFGVSRSEIERVTKENGLHTVEEVTNFCKAGGGCGMCRDRIQEVIDEVNHQAAAVPAPKPEKKLTTLQRIKLIEQTLEEQVRPVLKKDGGDVELVDVDGDTVKISFRGMCAGCRSAALTRDNLVATALHEFVDPALHVEMV